MEAVPDPGESGGVVAAAAVMYVSLPVMDASTL